MRAFSISVNMGILKEIYVHFSSLHIFTDQRDLISFFNTKLYYVFWLIDLKGKGFINKCCSSNTASSLKIMIRPFISSKKPFKCKVLCLCWKDLLSTLLSTPLFFALLLFYRPNVMKKSHPKTYIYILENLICATYT